MRCFAMLLLVAAPIRESDNSWVGKVVLVKKVGARISYVDEKGAERPAPHPHVDYRVLADRDGRLKVKSQLGQEGWFDKADAILLDDAVAYFTEVLAGNAGNVDAYSRRARARQLKGDLDRAIEDLSEALRLTPSAALFNNRAGVYLGKKDHDKALTDYNQALKLSPRNAAFLNNRGNVWTAKKEYDKAIADYDEALRLSPKATLAYVNRARAWSGKNDHDRAIADLGTALALDPSYLPAYSVRAAAWSGKKDYDQAIADYTKVLRADPNNVAAYHGRGKAWISKKHYERALADFNEALAFDPKNAASLNLRAWLWSTCPDPKFRDGSRALESAKKAVELAPKNAGFLDTLAAAHAENANFDEAVRVQELVLQSPELQNDADARRRLELYRKKEPYRQD